MGTLYEPDDNDNESLIACRPEKADGSKQKCLIHLFSPLRDGSGYHRIRIPPPVVIGFSPAVIGFPPCNQLPVSRPW